jgi:hypothetical protein
MTDGDKHSSLLVQNFNDKKCSIQHLGDVGIRWPAKSAMRYGKVRLIYFSLVWSERVRLG